METTTKGEKGGERMILCGFGTPVELRTCGLKVLNPLIYLNICRSLSVSSTGVFMGCCVSFKIRREGCSPKELGAEMCEGFVYWARSRNRTG